MRKRPRGARAKARDRRKAAVRALLDDAEPRVPPSPAKETVKEWIERLLTHGEGAQSAEKGGGA
jgi:hypothetical protein